MTMTKGFKIYCPSCKKYHIMTMQPCPECGVYTTPQPKSDKVYSMCKYIHYECEGCEAYRDHLK